MNKIITKDKINLEVLLFRVKKAWFWIGAFLLFTLAIAVVNIKYTNPVYRVSASVLIDNESTGPRKADELLMAMDIKGTRGINIEDEIGKLQSYSMVEKVINRLDFIVSYFETPNTWVNTFTDYQTMELYQESPFTVVLDHNSPQLVDVPIYIEFLTNEKARIRIDAKRGTLYDYRESKAIRPVFNIKYEKIIDLKKPYQDNYLSLQINPSEDEDQKFNDSKYHFVLNRTETLISRYQRKLDISTLKRDSRILILALEGDVPQKEMNFLNTLIDAYIEQDLEAKSLTGIKTIDFIDGQLKTITDSLSRAELALENFRSTNRIMDIGFASSTVFQRLERLEQEKSDMELRQRYYQSIQNYLDNDRDFSEMVSPSAVGINDPVLNSLIIELNRLYQQRAALQMSSTEGAPAYQAVTNQIQNSKASLVENVKNLINTANQTLSHISNQISNIEGNIKKLPASERALVDLQRKFDFNDQTYSFLLQKRAEAAIALATNYSDRKLVDQAMVGPMVAPNKNFAILVAVLVGILVPLGFIIAKDSFNNKITSKSDLKSVSDIPILGVVTHSTSKNVFDLYTNRKSSLADSFNAIRLNLKYFSLQSDHQVIGVTSAVSGEGKTFFSINLALELSVAGNRALLIGSDLRKPRMQEYLGGVVNLKKGVGLSTFLANQASIEDVINKTPIKNLDVIPAGPVPPNPLDLLSSERMKSMIESVKPFYDYIVLDTPPIGYVSEYLLLKEMTDTNIFIVRQNYTTSNSLTEINELYENKKIKNLCFVLNDVVFSSSYEYDYKSRANYYYSRKEGKKGFTINLNSLNKNKKIPLSNK
jgi:capsular exopolysaccharide synthesis family protein